MWICQLSINDFKAYANLLNFNFFKKLSHVSAQKLIIVHYHNIHLLREAANGGVLGNSYNCFRINKIFQDVEMEKDYFLDFLGKEYLYS